MIIIIFLLIVPVGIEICIVQSNKNVKHLLIVPVGIEICAHTWATSLLLLLLIVPVGIEIYFDTPPHSTTTQSFNRTSRNWNIEKNAQEPGSFLLLIVPVGIEIFYICAKYSKLYQSFNRTSRNWNTAAQSAARTKAYF